MDGLIAKLEAAEALIFDCDGTLVHSADAYAVAWAAGFGLSGRVMSPDWYHARGGMSESVLMDDFEQEFAVSLPRQAVVDTVRKTYLERLDQIREVEIVTAVARQYHGLKPMAVASGGSAEIVTASLKALKLEGLFDTIVTFDDVRKPKPEPDLFLEAAARLKIPAAACLVFEDSPQGLIAAQRAGMAAIDVCST